MLYLLKRCWLIPLMLLLAMAGCGGDGDGGGAVVGGNAPTISTQPVAQTVNEGTAATFAVVAAGDAPLSYQWQRNGVVIPGATSASYATPPASLADEGAQFAVVVTNARGSVTSAAAALHVTASPRGTLAGRVLAAAGAPLQGATVMVGNTSAVTDAGGNYTMEVPANSRVVAVFSAPDYARTVKPAEVLASATTQLSVQLLPVGTTQAVDVASGGTVAVPSSTAQVVLPANGIARPDGTAATGSVQVAVTPIAPAVDVNQMPGDYTALVSGAPTPIESFGAMLVDITDAAGVRYNLARGATATVRIPLSTRTPAAAVPATIPLFYFDETAARWVQEGSATLQGVAPNQYYEGTVTHFSYWNADQVLETIFVSGCVRDEGNQPVAGARMASDGIDYSGSSAAVTAADGTFRIAIKRNARATIIGISGTRLTNTVSTTASATDYTLPECLVVSNNEASLSIKLTWGSLPQDVDSHLLLPDNSHVWFSDTGSLVASPFAALDVDDTDGNGPEVVTVTKLMVGTYRYVVNNFSETFAPDMTNSPVRVEITRAGATNVFSPPPGEAANLYWHVFDVVVAADCTVTLQTVNAWSPALPAAVVNPAPTLCGGN